MHGYNRGKGAALRTGFQHCRGDVVAIQDADLEYDPADLPMLIEAIERGEADVVYGSRFLENAEQDPSRVHRLGNWLLTTASNLTTGQWLTDMETCYKVFRREVLAADRHRAGPLRLRAGDHRQGLAAGLRHPGDADRLQQPRVRRRQEDRPARRGQCAVVHCEVWVGACRLRYSAAVNSRG